MTYQLVFDVLKFSFEECLDDHYIYIGLKKVRNKKFKTKTSTRMNSTRKQFVEKFDYFKLVDELENK